MTKKQMQMLAAAAGLMLAQVPVTSQAAVDWTFDSSNCLSTVGGSCSAESWSSTRTYDEGGSGPDVTVSGWANTIGSNTMMQQGDVTHFGGGNGLGVRNADYPGGPNGGGDDGEGTPPEHAIDNNDRFDFVLFDFGASVTLSEVTLGFYSNDSDITVLAFTDPSSDPLDGDNVNDLNDRTLTATAQDLTGNGWTLIGNYDVDGIDGSSVPITAGINPGDVSASYWLIGANADIFGGTCTQGSSPDCDNSPKDYVKLIALAGDINTPPPPTTSVPEPSTLLALAGGLALIRRRRA